MISILFYYIKWTKKKFSVLLSSLPAVYFTYQIFSFRHWETTSVLITHIIELTLSVIFLIIWIYFYIRIRIESLACLKRKRLKMQQISADL
ncbi:hypothetical protein D355_01769 [Enterococcus faecium SD1C-2]|nr:hypothetical protein D355_01769 [Enterococcus faecium SD1C-2]